MEKITVEITPEQSAALKRLKKETGETLDYLVSRAVDEWLENTASHKAPDVMDETEYLLSSPANAARLMESLENVKKGKGLVTFDSVEELKNALKL